MNIDFEPFKPINTSLYLCDNKFHTEALTALLADDNKFGFIVMDGNGALFGTLQGNTREVCPVSIGVYFQICCDRFLSMCLVCFDRSCINLRSTCRRSTAEEVSQRCVSLDCVWKRDTTTCVKWPKSPPSCSSFRTSPASAASSLPALQTSKRNFPSPTCSILLVFSILYNINEPIFHSTQFWVKSYN